MKLIKLVGAIALILYGAFAGAPHAYGQNGFELHPESEAQVALKDGKPLPGLPDLNKSVFVKDGSLVCADYQDLILGRVSQVNNGGLMVPSLIAQKRCLKVAGDRQVSLLLPETDRQYLLDYRFGLIGIVVGSPSPSVANVDRLWVSIADLKNGTH